jgi:hypothetical protein
MLFLIRGWRDILSERHCLTTADVFVFSFITTKGERTRSRTHNTKPRILSSNIMAVAMSSAVYATAASAAGFSSTTRRSSSSAAGRMTRGARAPSSSSRNVGLLNNNNNRRAAVVAAAGPSSGSPADAFAQLESLLTKAAQAGGSSGERGWREVEGAWVLSPPNGVKPVAVVHFIGGAFVGASPQLTYRLFLEALTARGGAAVQVESSGRIA